MKKHPWNFIDLTGKKFNKLTVLKYKGSKLKNNGKKSSIWLCLCECGNKTIKTTQHLNAGAKSCGCILKTAEHAANYNPDRKYQYIKSLYGILKRNAKDRKIKFSLSMKDIENICFNNCYYCDNIPNQQIISTNKHAKNTFYHNGLDRLDPNLGYIINNVVPCCKNCNYAKRTLSKDNFCVWIQKCYFNLLKKGLI